jgi:acyl-CoA thioester hydrolase
MYSFEHKIRVRYKETDQMGYVHHSNYAQYYEIGRIEMFRHLGISYRKLEEDGYMLPIIELHSEFIQPAKYDNELTIVCKLTKKPSVRFYFEYEIINDKNTIINKGKTLLVMVDSLSRKPVRPPSVVTDIFEKYF